MGSMAAPGPLAELEAFALDLPGAFSDMPWEDDLVAKVGKKIFVFFGTAEQLSIGVKLPESGDHALAVPGAEPMSYGLGRHGWVVVPVGQPQAPTDLLRDWIEESYRAVATKRMIAELDARER
jgi:predicted DNA-binding protein (MmcQ/YjbR family)